jgi:hypothetical protein
MSGIDECGRKGKAPKRYEPEFILAGHVFNRYMTVIVRWGAT